MEKRELGRTGDMVTSVCLGTMTWGEQNTEAEAHAQLDYAIGAGINFIDTAEMYPVPGRAETQGRTEDYIGTWINGRKKRDDFYLATKVTGLSGMSWTRDGDVRTTRHNKAQIDEAVEKSLKRMKTDYIDLYQLHWPDRPVSGFGFHSYKDYDTSEMEPLLDILTALDGHVKSGNIRHIGISNETAWGMMKFVQLAETHNLPRIASIQNVYSLVARRFDYAQAEVSMREDIGLLPYSILGMGYLTGKYDDGKAPKGSRKDLFPDFLGRYHNDGGLDAIKACNEAAHDLGITPTQFALKFTESREFVTSNIIGATTLEQLKDNIDAHSLEWTKEMESAAHDIHKRYRSPVC